jgi:NTE family protein
MTKPSPIGPGGKYDKQIALILQGGGALGSYQAGVYQALSEYGCEPNWVAGISIGAIGSAIIAGNPPRDRVAKLREFWELVSSPTAVWPDLPYAAWQDAMRRSAALSALAFGQPGFFRPKMPGATKAGTSVPSFYDTAGLKSTLERLVDFDRINSGETRFSAGAVNVRNGNFIYFDSAREKIRPEHVMASGALPPGFPAIEIDGEFYWDGGLVSNTPLRYVLESLPRHSTLAFQVDLFSARGAVPKNLEAVAEREKDIRYSSRTRMSVETFRYTHNLRRNISKLIAKLPETLKKEPEVEFLHRVACQTTMDIVELVYRPGADLGPSKDFEFLRATMERRWEQGLRDARATLAAAPWLEPAPPEIAVRTFDVTSGRTATGGRLSHLSPAAAELPRRTSITAA